MFPDLRTARMATHLEFTHALAMRHHFVLLPSGKVSRTLGPPDPALVEPTRSGRVWRAK